MSTLLTTGQAARLCSVTPDTVLKWIRSGRLRARRTAGGHHRIDRSDLTEFLGHRGERAIARGERAVARSRPFRYCWEHMGRGRLLDGCRECVVYELRAHRCYEVIKLAPDGGHTKQFCTKSCEECDYFRTVHQRATHVLLVSDDARLADSLSQEALDAPFSFATTHCEYTCSAMVETFRPDYVVVDCSLGPDPSRDIANHLSEDPRVPFVKVIMATDDGQLPAGCDKVVFATIDKPLKIEQITSVIYGAEAPGPNGNR